MIYTIKGEQPIQILTDAFSIGPSSEGYVLQISSNGYDYSDLFSVGPNVTRMVTGVASGSYYRLKGNASEVDINWIKNCGGGSGSGAQGPAGPQGPQGPAGEPASGSGDSYVLLPSSALPEYVITNYVWETWEDDTYKLARETCTNDGDYLMHWDNSERFKGVVIAGGTFSPSQGYGMEMGEDGKMHCTDSNFPDITAWIEDGKLYWNNPYGVISMLDAYGVGSDKEGGIYTEYRYIPDAAGSVRATSGGVYQVRNNAWFEIGGDSGIEHVDTLPAEGESGKTYECNGRLFEWVTSSGVWGKWYGDTNFNSETDFQTKCLMFRYSVFPSGNTAMFNVARYNTKYLWVRYEAATNVIAIYSDSAYTTLVKSVQINTGEQNTEISAGRKLYITWTDGLIQIKVDGGYTNISDICSTTASGSHYEAYDVAETAPAAINNGVQVGWPIWNEQGVVVGKAAELEKKTVKINGAGTNFVYRGGNGGVVEFWAPSSVGTQGQVLVSNGSGAPSWTTMIKALQITSADYEALTTKDPNTLYLIVG